MTRNPISGQKFCNDIHLWCSTRGQKRPLMVSTWVSNDSKEEGTCLKKICPWMYSDLYHACYQELYTSSGFPLSRVGHTVELFESSCFVSVCVPTWFVPSRQEQWKCGGNFETSSSPYHLFHIFKHDRIGIYIDIINLGWWRSLLRACNLP